MPEESRKTIKARKNLTKQCITSFQDPLGTSLEKLVDICKRLSRDHEESEQKYRTQKLQNGSGCEREKMEIIVCFDEVRITEHTVDTDQCMQEHLSS